MVKVESGEFAMTEAEWLECTDPTPMLEFLRGKASARKLRLFAVAYFRWVWLEFTAKETQEAWRIIEIAERYADELASDQELQMAHDVAHSFADDFLHTDLGLYFMGTYGGAATAADVAKALTFATAADYSSRTALHAPPIIEADRIQRCNLLREIFGNRFSRQSIHPAWLSWNEGTVGSLAQSIYDERAFDQLPILADELEKAGCANPEILGHCRGTGRHFRGCWVLDLVLGKE
jgi:hypothetical protein